MLCSDAYVNDANDRAYGVPPTGWVADRVRQHGTLEKLILVLNKPVSRTYRHRELQPCRDLVKTAEENAILILLKVPAMEMSLATKVQKGFVLKDHRMASLFYVNTMY